MNKMIVSPWLSVSPRGPITCASEEASQVHLRQGEMDGACGPYCLVMALITLGILGREEVQNMHLWDGRTREGRFRNNLLAFGSLISSGTDELDLSWLADCFKGKGVRSKIVDGAKKEIIKNIAQAIDGCQIPIMSVHWAGGAGHWLMMVGYQGFEHEGSFQLTHLLCLDPGSEAPKTTLWNAVIEVLNDDGSSVNKGRLPSNHWGLDGNRNPCRISTTVILGTG